MTFEGHTDRAPRLLDGEQGEALLAIQEAAPEPPGEAGLDLFAITANEVQGGGFNPSRFHHLSRLPPSGIGGPPNSTDGPQDAA